MFRRHDGDGQGRTLAEARPLRGSRARARPHPYRGHGRCGVRGHGRGRAPSQSGVRRHDFRPAAFRERPARDIRPEPACEPFQPRLQPAPRQLHASPSASSISALAMRTACRRLRSSVWRAFPSGNFSCAFSQFANDCVHRAQRGGPFPGGKNSRGYRSLSVRAAPPGGVRPRASRHAARRARRGKRISVFPEASLPGAPVADLRQALPVAHRAALRAVRTPGLVRGGGEAAAGYFRNP